MSRELIERFQQYVRDHQLISPGHRLLLACSGGVDSMVLAHLLQVGGYDFALAHCHFQLRGREADLDAELVATWAKREGYAHFQVQFDTKAKAKEWKKGIQETARKLRYDWLRQVQVDHGYGRLLTAHHQDDQVETVLMHFFKGTGLAGMRGMLAQSGDLIRPLLFAEKKSILDYANTQGLVYRDDASNQEDDYLRNALRLHVIPAIEKWFPQAGQQMGLTISHLGEAAQLYDQAITLQKKRLVETRGQDQYLPIRKWRQAKPLPTIAYEVFKDYGFRSAQIPQILGLMDGISGQFVHSDTHRVIRDRDFLIITALAPENTDFILIEKIPFHLNLEEYKLKGSLEPRAPLDQGSDHRVYLHAQELKFPLILRRWKLGDYFYPLGMGGKKKKLSRYFIEKKIPLHLKEKLWILESENRIVWVLGMRLDERFKVMDSASPAVCLQLSENRSK